MRPSPSLLFLPAVLLLGAPCLGQLPETVRMTIETDAYNVPVGKPFAVRINGERVTMRIETLTEQSFDEAGVSFRYPVSLTPEVNDQDQAVTIWTLQGKSAAVMLQKYASGLEPASLSEVLVGNIIEQYGADRVKQSAVKLTGAEGAYPGLQLSTTRDGVQIVQNVFAFANRQGVFALMLQDTRPEGEAESDEYQAALRLLGESLKTGPEPTPAPAAPERPAQRRRGQR